MNSFSKAIISDTSGYDEPLDLAVLEVDDVTWADGGITFTGDTQATSLAGHWGLGKLVVLYDANEISIDGSTELTFTESVANRFSAYGWQVLHCDGHDRDQIEARIEEERLAAAK